MNRYAEDGQFIIDATGKQWPVETAHPLPLPEGIYADDYDTNGYGPINSILFGGKSNNGPTLRWGLPASFDTHWLARRPLPPVPRPKSQDELDADAFENWQRTCGGEWTTRNCWNAALVYERARKDQ